MLTSAFYIQFVQEASHHQVCRSVLPHPGSIITHPEVLLHTRKYYYTPGSIITHPEVLCTPGSIIAHPEVLCTPGSILLHTCSVQCSRTGKTNKLIMKQYNEIQCNIYQSLSCFLMLCITSSLFSSRLRVVSVILAVIFDVSDRHQCME